MTVREVRASASALNAYIGDHEYCYVKGTRMAGNILTPSGRAAREGELLVMNSRRNYQSLQYKNRALVDMTKTALQSRLSGSRAASPNIIDSQG